MARFPQDRFDAVPDAYPRIGVHRARPRRGRALLPLAWALVATAVLVGGGIVGVEVFAERFGADGSGTASASGPATEDTVQTVPEAPAQAVFAPGEVVTVLNGSTTDGLASTVADRVAEAGWTVGTAANAVQQDVATTPVYFADPLDEGAARGLVQTLGMGAVERSDAFPGSSLTLVLGNDYQG